jgi:hypothetical protein
MAKQNHTTKTMPKMQITILEQTTQKEGRKMTTPDTKTQGKTIILMDNQQENKQELLRIVSGYNQHASLFYEPAPSWTVRS